MKTFKTKVDRMDNDVEYIIECYDNTEPINVGDKFLFFFSDITDVQVCCIDDIEEINKNDRVKDNTSIDLVTEFWRNCFKIKNTTLDLNLIS